MKIIIKIITVIISGYFLGIILDKSLFIDMLYSTSIINIMISLIISLFFSVFIHEASHALYFLCNKIEISMVGIFIFILQKENDSWKIKISFNNVTIFGGIVIPDLPIIDSEKEFKRIQKIYSNDLLFAPMISLVNTIISLILYFYYIYCNNINSFIMVILGFSSLFSLIIFISSFSKFEILYGDFPASKNFRSNDIFAANQLCQYIIFSNNYKNILKGSNWLLNYLIEYIKVINVNNLELKDIRILDLMIQMDYMDIIKLDNVILNNLKYLIINEKILNLQNSEERDIFYCHTLFCLKEHSILNDEKIKNYYLHNKHNLFINNNHCRIYYQQLSEHILFSLNNNIIGIYPNSSYSFFQLFQGINEIENKIINYK